MTKEQIFLAALEKRDKEAEKNYDILKNQNKTDEATFEKIKRNVYQIYIKMFRVSMRSDDLVKTFDNYLEMIPKNWILSLEESRDLGDFETEHIELVKLETKDEINDIFKKVYE